MDIAEAHDGIKEPWEYILSQGCKVRHSKLYRHSFWGSFLQVAQNSRKSSGPQSQSFHPVHELLSVLAEALRSLQFSVPII